ncbi:MAG: uracil-DNA glycosylase [Clostridia bacterium]
MVNIGNDWDSLLQAEFSKAYYLKLREFLKQEYSSKKIYPEMQNIFQALKTTAFNHVKIVILGQDPYHGAGQAHGMCFSVQEGVPKPPSLVNIFKELETDLGIPKSTSGYLVPWAQQGVLLLNTVLTVRAGEANSHKGKGWEFLTDRIIQLLNEHEQPVVFLLWGANARNKKVLLTNPKHLVLETVHPSPLSAYNGFFGCKHFSQANNFLIQQGRQAVSWKL